MNVKFGTKVASSRPTKMMRALRLLGNFLIVAEFAKKLPKIGQNANFLKTLAETAYAWRHRASGFSAEH